MIKLHSSSIDPVAISCRSFDELRNLVRRMASSNSILRAATNGEFGMAASAGLKLCNLWRETRGRRRQPHQILVALGTGTVGDLGKSLFLTMFLVTIGARRLRQGDGGMRSDAMTFQASIIRNGRMLATDGCKSPTSPPRMIMARSAFIAERTMHARYRCSLKHGVAMNNIHSNTCQQR